MQETNKQVLFASRPIGWVSDDNFRFVTRDTDYPEHDGDVLIRNIYLSVDPYMRGRMNSAQTYAAGFELGKVLTGGAIGQVEMSNNPNFKVGDFVNGMLGWEEYSMVRKAAGLVKVDPKAAPLSYYLGVLGMPGMTAYVGLLDMGEPKAGETVYVSAASGAVGQIVGQIAKIKGCRVVGSAGSDEKVDFLLNELGFDAAFNYKTAATLGTGLRETCPDGIDVYFENVGGAMLDAVLMNMNPFGRIAACGMINQYNLKEPEGVKYLGLVVGKKIRIQGFIVSDHLDRQAAFRSDVGRWLKSGELKYREDIADGLDNAPTAFIGMLKGENLGKQVVQIGTDPTK